MFFLGCNTPSSTFIKKDERNGAGVDGEFEFATTLSNCTLIMSLMFNNHLSTTKFTTNRDCSLASFSKRTFDAFRFLEVTCKSNAGKMIKMK